MDSGRRKVSRGTNEWRRAIFPHRRSLNPCPHSLTRASSNGNVYDTPVRGQHRFVPPVCNQQNAVEACCLELCLRASDSTVARQVGQLPGNAGFMRVLVDPRAFRLEWPLADR